MEDKRQLNIAPNGFEIVLNGRKITVIDNGDGLFGIEFEKQHETEELASQFHVVTSVEGRTSFLGFALTQEALFAISDGVREYVHSKYKSHEKQ